MPQTISTTAFAELNKTLTEEQCQQFNALHQHVKTAAAKLKLIANTPRQDVAFVRAQTAQARNTAQVQVQAAITTSNVELFMGAFEKLKQDLDSAQQQLTHLASIEPEDFAQANQELNKVIEQVRQFCLAAQVKVPWQINMAADMSDDGASVNLSGGSITDGMDYL